MSKLIKDLGAVSAYAYAVEKGYTGTEDEFAELMYDYADVAQTAVEAKDEAVSASTSAQASATIANTKAAEASTSASNAQSASNSAQGAETNAENFALNAGTKATEAKQFADKAELNAQKTQSDKEVVESAKSDVLSAVDNAQNYANSAQSASQAIQNMDVEATTLEPDSDATVEKTVDAISGAVTLTYGIPKGQVGEKGDKGDTGDSGVYIGTSAPSDENVNVWINPEARDSDVAIMIDEEPTKNSTNAVSSGGVYAVTADLDARVEDLEQGGTGGMSMTAVNLLNTILTEAVYGSDQTANIALLKKELSNIPPVSISAVLDGTALAGQAYSELSFIVTATFDDESTQVVDNYTIVTTGTVTAGSNTVTIRYRGITTTCTFTAEQVTTYSITYNLTNVASSSDVSVVRENAYYNTILSVEDGYTFDSCTVTMGGVDITSTAFGNMEILITEVTGNVVITASATEITYMDDLLPTRNEGFSSVEGYPNGTTTETKVIGGYYEYVPFVSEYPALNDCTVHWTIKNISEEDISLSGCGFGNIDNTNLYDNSAAYINAFYCVKSDNSSHTLVPGAELEGDVTVKSGMQLCFICKYNDFSKFEIKLIGNYIPNTFSEYSEVNPTNDNTSTYGAYRQVTYYRDNGTESITTKNGAPRQIPINLEMGTYDMYCAVQTTIPTSGARNTECYVGGMTSNTDTNVYYAGGADRSLGIAIWHHFSFTITENNMAFVIGTGLSAMNNTDTTLRILYKKVV